MIFEQIATGGCQSYLVGCEDTLRAVADRSRDSARSTAIIGAGRRSDGLRIHYVVDTHTHADHFSASRELAARWTRRW